MIPAETWVEQFRLENGGSFFNCEEWVIILAAIIRDAQADAIVEGRKESVDYCRKQGWQGVADELSKLKDGVVR